MIALLPCLILCGGSLPAQATAVTFTSNTTITAGETTYDGKDITVSGCTVKIDGSHSFDSLYVTANGTVTNDPGLTDAINLTIATFVTVDAGSTITATGCGYASGAGPGAGGNASSSAATGGGGASYGGSGSDGTNGVPTGTPYGSYDQPMALGSGGGFGDATDQAGGAGGGAIILTVDGTLTINGQMTCDGVSGTNDGGAGSGGSMYLTVGALAGAGYMSASGGAGTNEYDTGIDGGSGGGGRIAIYYMQDTYSGTMVADGAPSEYNEAGPSGAGTIFTRSSTQVNGSLLVQNFEGAGVTCLAGPNATGPFTFDEITVGPGGVLGTWGLTPLNLNVTGNVTIEPGGFITTSGTGYGSNTGPGAGSNAGTSSTPDGGGGGSYGGVGTAGTNGGGPGATYGSVKQPMAFGSGGGVGDSNNNGGGTGGGLIEMNVVGTLTDDGLLSSDGGSGFDDGGAGSGGSILLVVGALTGGGRISANGGFGTNDYDTGVGGGAGGGGRIAVYYVSQTFTGTMAANGGGSDNAGTGGAGTIYTQQTVGQYTATIALNPSVLAGGQQSTATIMLSQAAPTGGITVALSSSNTAAATVQSSVVVPSGATTMTFQVTAVSTPVPQTAVISAELNGSSSSATLTVEPWLLSLTPSPTSLSSGTKETLTLTLNPLSPAPPNGLVVNLSSTDSVGAPVPVTMTVPAGKTSTSVSFTAGTVSSAETVTITAGVGIESRTCHIYIDPAGVTLAGLTVTPPSVVGGPGVSIGTVTLAKKAPTGGAIVALSNSNPTAAMVPAYVTVDAGRTSEPFVIATNPVASTQAATLTATLGSTQTTVLTVNVQGIASVTFAPASIAGGETAIGIVTLEVAPSAPVTITLSSSSLAEATPTANIVIPAGQTVGWFYVDTAVNYTAGPFTPTITASANGSTFGAVLTINQTPPPTLMLTPQTVVGGQTVSAMITLNDTAPPGGQTVNLTNTNTSATVPASVTVPAGAASVTFPISTVPPGSANVVGTVTATIGSEVSNGETLTVTPASALPAPILTATAATGGLAPITLSWTASSGATSYIVYRGTAPGGEVLTVGGITSTTYTDTSLTAAGAYYYYVVANSGSGSSGPSNEASATVVQQLTSIAVSPGPTFTISGALPQSKQFTATANDQFGNALSTQPTFVWSLATGSVGSISDAGGLYHTGTIAGSATVKAKSGAVMGTCAVTIN